MTDDNEKMKNNMRVNAFYTKKIHTNTEFYENEKRRVAEYQKNRYENDNHKCTKMGKILKNPQFFYFLAVQLV